MALHVALNHQTHYRYDRRVQMGPHVIRLRPAPHSRTPILSYALKIEPTGYFLNWQQDPHGNYLARIIYPEKVQEFHVEVDLVADMVIYNPFDFFLEPDAETLPFNYDPLVKDDLLPYLATEPPGPRLQEWLRQFTAPHDDPTVPFLMGLNQQLKSQIDYVVRMEPGVQTPDETLQLGRGSCRDTGWLLVQILRHLGIASRFVSGYLIQLVADVPSLDGPSGTDRDFTDLHAWVEAYLPGAGWVGLDATSGLMAGEGHIPLACTPHPLTAAPISGAMEICETTFSHEMSVTRIVETPRVTKPYTEEQWQTIDQFGQRLDQELASNDVRLTIGGEPTFISIDHPDAPEWNTEAVGDTKRPLAANLIKRLRERFAPGGLLHFGQGKWYPGEPLPRWAFSLYWRQDGKPIWQEDQLFAKENQTSNISADDANHFIQGIAKRVEVGTKTIQPVYEDPWHFIGQERKLPENLEPATNNLDDPMARARLAKVYERGLGKPAGYVLPLQRWNAKDGPRRWITAAWTTRSQHLFLVPGDSPIGFRLPLPSLPVIDPKDYPYIIPTDPFDIRGPLPDPIQVSSLQEHRLPKLRGEGGQHEPAQVVMGQQSGIGAGGVVRASLTVEPRNGHLCVFMPPLESAEDYLDLVAVIKDTAAELHQPIHLEGYTPPYDPRLNVLKITPDPGVLEVNIHPAKNWADMVAITTAIYEEARLCRLGTEKFMLDGRHTGTGGGNHVVMGGNTPADSPFLRRPDLLRSMIAYWQRHPSLSYVFSGLFIGPTSQAPRIDEARHDSLYELELGFAQVPAPNVGAPPPPWLVDRIFRNLLIDVTGNTHRTEICIDKLYSPDGPTGRLGLVEFRAFEMPPHERMSLAQQVLLLALVARFWKTPDQGNLVRWGTQLHDRFMLPHFLSQDLHEVIQEMNRAGYELQNDWFAPHLEFRFPLFGSINYGSLVMEVRQALEPWHVMGEQGAPGGTVRYVDSSVERLQIKLSGLTENRYIIACNGKRVPMIPTGRQGEAVGGVRYRAWQPPNCLHPKIGIDAPLTFDIYDQWAGRAVAGCTYHVAHPGGRNFEHFPVNAYEAESRRLARFHSFGHTAGPYAEPPDTSRPEFPCTLDLRWPA
ncbi:transglutaminase family protein [Candidatus Nitrospira neomarina]|uniref:Transglutaminase family protein n=1 Tax=Candidatus Nitrospira neomarina TaxID=3020899 RepID=A0AA96GSF1_9BACT|nr:transglutaminase family protein [Candidatus Nitrospira neomarina]WNM62711.1 transglutaminase family protein [Candidatus Nitrospira neomarina]